MHTLLQTQPDISEMAIRMYAGLIEYVLGSVEPAFPIAFGEYGLATSLTLVVALFAGAMGLGELQRRLDSTVSARGSDSSEPATLAATDLPEDFPHAYHNAAAQEIAPGRTATTGSAAVAAGAQPAPPAGIPVRLAALSSRVVAGLACFAIVSYLATSAVLFMVRLLVGVG